MVTMRQEVVILWLTTHITITIKHARLSFNSYICQKRKYIDRLSIHCILNWRITWIKHGIYTCDISLLSFSMIVWRCTKVRFVDVIYLCYALSDSILEYEYKDVFCLCFMTWSSTKIHAYWSIWSLLTLSWSYSLF